MGKFINLSKSDKFFYILVTLLMTIFFLIVLYPCIFVLSASFSSGSAVMTGKVVLWPVDFTFEGYKTVFKTKDIWIGFRNSLFYTVVGTSINMILTMSTAYALSRKDLVGRNAIMFILTFTMFFSGGMMPTYLLVKKLGMLNTIWAVIIPGALGIYNTIIARSFIESSIPNELLEASQIDGCSDIKYFTRVVLPLSKAVIAVLILYYGVGHWNNYFRPMLYLHDREIYPLTIFLKEILMADKIDPDTIADPELASKLAEMTGVIKYSLIVVSMIPVMIIYPFVQKNFVKGVMIGSVKG